MRATLSLLITLTLLGGCAQAGSPRAGRSLVPPRPPRLGPVDVVDRTTRVEVPPGFENPWLEFVDYQHGYGMFTRCVADGCQGRLFSTADGGVSWQARSMPVDHAKEMQLYVGDADTIAVFAEDWYVSSDQGRTWGPTRWPGYETPVELELAQARYGMNHTVSQGFDWATRQQVLGPLEDKFGTLSMGLDGDLWYYYPRGTTYRSTDAGLTWREYKLPEQPHRGIITGRVLAGNVAKDDDLWLIAEQEPTGPGSGGGSAPLRGSVFKGGGLPVVWKFDRNSGWLAYPMSAIKEDGNSYYSVTPAGADSLFVAGQSEFGVVSSSGYTVIKGLRPDGVRELRDGTVAGYTDAGSMFLGLGVGGPERQWVRVSLSHSR